MRAQDLLDRGFDPNDLEEAFQYEVLKMLKKEGKINDTTIENMLSWHYNVIQAISPKLGTFDKKNLRSGPPWYVQNARGRCAS